MGLRALSELVTTYIPFPVSYESFNSDARSLEAFWSKAILPAVELYSEIIISQAQTVMETLA